MNRRRFVAGVSGMGLAALAGCTGSSDTDADVEANVGDASTATATKTATASPTPSPTPTAEPTPKPSQLQGYSGENRTYVDVQYRNYTDAEVAAVKESAKAVDYRDLFRNVESYVGTSVTYRAVVGQFIEEPTHGVALLFFNNSYEEAVYASWTGGRLLQGDYVEVWGQVIGIEIYQSANGGEVTVPALSLADVELLENE